MNAFDLVVEGGSVIDGNSGSEPTLADVGVKNGLIAAVGDLSGRARAETIDATSRVVTPGFIDTHTHIEIAALRNHPDRFAAISQGVTTTFVGADGFGWVGLAPNERERWWQDTAAIYGSVPEPVPAWERPEEFLAELRAASPQSVIPLVPHGNVRASVMGDKPGPADASERKAMRTVVESWMTAGAVGIATGLDYLPARYATTDELVDLVEVVASNGGAYASHIRLLDSGRADAWREAAEIGRRAGVGVRIAHERLDEEGGALLDEVSEIAEVTVDSYVYPAGCTSLAFHVPAEMLADGAVALSERLAADGDLRNRLAEHLQSRMTGNPGQEAIIAATTSGENEGRTLSSLAQERGVTVGEVAVELLRDEMPSALLVYIWQNADAVWDATVARTMNDPRTFISSDGVYLGSSAHPRGFGTFPRILGELARDKRVVSLSQAIHKMTGRPADAYALRDRGRVAEGLRADLVVFDPDRVGSAANVEQPRQSPVGIDAVLVEGKKTTQGAITQ